MHSEVLLIIPAYNEEDNIARVVGTLESDYPQYDYVVVNDGSKDGTASICREHDFRFLDLPINLGLAGAFQVALKYADKHGYVCRFSLTPTVSIALSTLLPWSPLWPTTTS